jgi:hypothetical protein
MTRVVLEILRGPYKSARTLGLQIESCRLLVDVSLWGGSKWMAFRPAIVDTGAPLCLFPRRAWTGADVRVLGRTRVGGIRNKPECMLDVAIAVVTLAIRDSNVQFGPIETHAVLADVDDVPALIGIRGVLTGFSLHVDLPNGLAYLESSSMGAVS